MKKMKLFLLSIGEAEKLTKEQKIAEFNGRPVWWWLRTPGCFSDCVTYVDSFGHICDEGDNIYNIYNGVRPALQIKTSICDRLPKTKDNLILFGRNSITEKPIEWLIIEIENETVTLLSKEILVLREFNEKGKGTHFATSGIVKFMNTTLLETSFFKNEQDMILPVNKKVKLLLPGEVLIVKRVGWQSRYVGYEQAEAKKGVYKDYVQVFNLLTWDDVSGHLAEYERKGVSVKLLFGKEAEVFTRKRNQF